MTNEFSPPVQQADNEDGFDFVAMLLRRKWIVISLGLVGLVLGLLAYYRATPQYESVAQVLIERKSPMAAELGMGGRYDAYGSVRSATAEVEKHSVLMTTPSIVAEAFQKNHLEALPSLQGENPIKDIIENLTVMPITEGLSVYNVIFRGTDPDDAQAVVTAILETYEGFLEDTHHDTGQETRELINYAKDELYKKLNAKRENYASFKKASPAMWDSGTGENLYTERLHAIRTELTQTTLAISQLETELQSVRVDLQRNDDPWAVLASGNFKEFQSSFTTRYGSMSLNEKFDDKRQADRSILLPLLQEQYDLVARYGKQHPKVRSLSRRIEYTKSFYSDMGVEMNTGQEGLSGEQITEADSEFLVKRAAELEQHLREHLNTLITAKEQQLEMLHRQAQRLEKDFAIEQEAAKEMIVFLIQDQNFRDDIDNLKQMYELVLKRFEETSVVKDTEGYTYRLVAQPGPGQKVAPMLPKMLGMGTMLGLLAGCGLGFLIEVADKSFKSPMEVSQQLNLPVIGHIPLKDELTVLESAKQVKPIVATIHAPKQNMAEAYRTVRTALYFNAAGESHQVIQVTSPRPGDGKSSLSANLAVAIANSGKTCLLVDADFRRPTQHKVFGIENEIGLASVVQGMVQPADAYQTLPMVKNLTLMSCGHRPANPSELCSSAAFRTTLDLLRKQFDFVIVDTPPVLAVSDPSAVAAQVDGVILTLRIHRQARPLSIRAREVLKAVGANVIGVVINGVTTEAKGYYGYGGSRYAYEAYRYGYGYNYQYGDEEDGTGKKVRRRVPATTKASVS